ncbi:MFS transporter [Streptacidiphilus sp. PB12-B1b]|uniref:MFS transporter n=1 Tax=Streptacidiphilus sp. PB12-B1b TaxID=2705012 RepID=UPI0015F893B5|nr:MFS transporter [Streptacidiphilus sp. PB12-B1b]QMU79668.1 MFS transporter [Streptacidiphilus sp. PB12-B1b]
MTRTLRQQKQAGQSKSNGQNGTAASTLRRVQLGNALSAFGSGFTVPYMFVYVDQVRGLGSMTAWLMFTVFALAALAVLPFSGRGIDRWGPRPVLVVGAVTAALGAFAFGHATGSEHILAAAFLFGAGVTTVQPALATMIVRCSTPATRSHAFALQFTLVNLGMGIGAMIGGQIVDVHRPASLTLLFSIEGLMFLVLAAVTGSVRIPGAPALAPAPAARSDRGTEARSGFPALLRDKAMIRVCLLAGLIFFTCYGQFESGVAAYATSVVGTSPSILGFALGANTLVIVVLQMIVVRMTARRRRSAAIAATGLVWLGAWAMAGVAGLIRGDAMIATVAMVSVYALFGVGEALLAPTLGPIVADLAPARLLGTYNAAFALVKQIAVAMGPAAGVLLVGAGASVAYLAVMAGCTVLITVLALRLRHQLTPLQDNAVHPERVVAGSAALPRPRPELRPELQSVA